MLADIPAALLNGVPIGGFLALFFWMLATGRIVTGNVYRDAIQERDKAQERYEEQLRINRTVSIPLAEFTTHAMRSLNEAAVAASKTPGVGEGIPIKEPT